MKNSIYIFGLLMLLFTSCKPELKEDIGEPFDKVAGISGTWELTSFIQQDLNNPVLEERDFSDFYLTEGVDPLTITFNQDDRSYAVQIVEGKNFFGEGGTWSYDNDQYPTSLFLDDGSVENRFGLGSVVREFDNTLTIQLEKGCSETDLNVIYKFIFNRAQ